MALTVEGTDSFRTAVETALREICPSAKILDTGEVALDKATCSEYCAHRAGCHLLADLVGGSTKVVVVEDDFSSTYDHYDDQVEWRNGWNGDQTCDGEGCAGSGTAVHPATAILAHELIHAWHHHVTGTFAAGGKLPSEEHCTVCAENQLRAELGDVVRCRYKSSSPCIACTDAALAELKTDQGYDCRLLDVASRRDDCTCESEPGPEPEPEPGPEPEPEPGDGCGCLPAPLWRLLERALHGSSPQPMSAEPPAPASGRGQRVPEDRLEQSGFSGLLQSEGELAEQLREAARELVLRRERDGLPEVEERFREADDGVILELVDMHGGYRVLLFALTEGSAVFMTNVRLEGVNGRTILGGPGDLLELPLTAEEAESLRSELRGPTFGPSSGGMGGRPVLDGQAQFLRVKQGGQVRETVTRALRFRGEPNDDSHRPPEDGDDAARWDAIKTVLDLGWSRLRREAMR